MKWTVASPLKISLLDDHSLVREILKVRISLEPDFKAHSVYSSSKEMLEDLDNQAPDVLVLNCSSSDGELGGPPLIQLISSQYPSIKIVAYSASETPASASSCIRAGANGFVGKSQEIDELIRAIRMVAVGQIYTPPTMAIEQGKTEG